MSQRTHKFFDADLLNKREAGDFWRRCMKVIDVANKHKQTPGTLHVKHMHAELVTLYDNRGRLVRFWLRTVVGNRLLIVGNRDGLLPLDVEPVHVR